MKKTGNHGGIENVEHDWISSLPDEVLAHILSFLFTKEAIQTCVLSKRWRKTWAIVPVLDFSIDQLLMDDLDGKEGRKSVARFERFVHGVLDNWESTNLDIVHCQIHRAETLIPMEWLDRVVLLMPRVIHINIYGVNMFETDLPDLLFSCASLQQLVLEFCTVEGHIIKPMSIFLPSLKVLELSGVELLDDFPQKLFMGCPSLESLKLCYCDLYFSSISSIKLKKLSIVRCYLFMEMRISCPDLVSLLISSGHQGKYFGFLLKDMTSLVSATVKLHKPWFWYSGPVLNLFDGLSNVTNLELQMNFPKCKGQLEKDILNCRNFNNLKKLCIGVWNMSCDIYLIACFLKYSPNLNDLTLTLCANPADTQQEPRQEVLEDVSFQHEYLETVKISSKSNSEWASELIKTLDKYVKKIGNIIIT